MASYGHSSGSPSAGSGSMESRRQAQPCVHGRARSAGAGRTWPQAGAGPAPGTAAPVLPGLVWRVGTAAARGCYRKCRKQGWRARWGGQRVPRGAGALPEKRTPTGAGAGRGCRRRLVGAGSPCPATAQHVPVMHESGDGAHGPGGRRSRTAPPPGEAVRIKGRRRSPRVRGHCFSGS